MPGHPKGAMMYNKKLVDLSIFFAVVSVHGFVFFL
jgi:hypothetical protein